MARVTRSHLSTNDVSPEPAHPDSGLVHGKCLLELVPKTTLLLSVNHLIAAAIDNLVRSELLLPPPYDYYTITTAGLMFLASLAVIATLVTFPFTSIKPGQSGPGQVQVTFFWAMVQLGYIVSIGDRFSQHWPAHIQGLAHASVALMTIDMVIYASALFQIGMRAPFTTPDLEAARAPAAEEASLHTYSAQENEK